MYFSELNRLKPLICLGLISKIPPISRGFRHFLTFPALCAPGLAEPRGQHPVRGFGFRDRPAAAGRGGGRHHRRPPPRSARTGSARNARAGAYRGAPGASPHRAPPPSARGGAREIPPASPVFAPPAQTNARRRGAFPPRRRDD